MSKSYRICLAVFGFLAIPVVCAVLAFNLHLQSPAMQDRLRQGAMETIGLPLTVRRAIYTPWDGILLRGLVVPDMENERVNFLEASEFQIVFRLIPLLRREFVVSRLQLKEAVLTWRQNDQGQWKIPREPAKALSLPAAPPTASAPSPTPTAQPTPAPAFGVRVEKLSVLRSRILFENRDGWPLLDADGITASADLDSSGDARGHARVPEAVLAGLVVATDLSSTFTLEDGDLLLPDINGEVSGGRLTGRGAVSSGKDGSPYEWTLRLEDLHLGQLRLPAKLSGSRIEGLLTADLEIAGRNAPRRQILGTSRLEVAQGRLVPSPYLQEIGRVLDIRELRGMDLKQAFADLRIDNDIIHVEPLWLLADELAVELKGTVTRGGKLDLAGRLLLSPQAASRVAGQTGRELPTSDDPSLPDFRVLDFTVTGTLQDPKSDLVKRLLGGGVSGRVGEFLLNLLGAP